MIAQESVLPRSGFEDEVVRYSRFGRAVLAEAVRWAKAAEDSYTVCRADSNVCAAPQLACEAC